MTSWSQAVTCWQSAASMRLITYAYYYVSDALRDLLCKVHMQCTARKYESEVIHYKEVGTAASAGPGRCVSRSRDLSAKLRVYIISWCSNYQPIIRSCWLWSEVLLYWLHLQVITCVDSVPMTYLYCSIYTKGYSCCGKCKQKVTDTLTTLLQLQDKWYTWHLCS